MSRSVLIPITNVHAKGDYTAQVHLGSQRQSANLILDTGSSSLVVQSAAYHSSQDRHLTPTAFAQAKLYGIGGWAGPVVRTRVALGQWPFRAALEATNVAIAEEQQTGCFGDADGMIGLAYRELNQAHDLTDYLTENDMASAHTHPWKLADAQRNADVHALRRVFRQYPQSDLTPYFTQLEQSEVVGNQFAFVIHRSSVYQTHHRCTREQLARHPLNNGIFVLGHPRQHDHLHAGDFQQIEVLHDKYYNVHLHSLRVDGGTPIAAPSLAPEHVKGSVSNAIVDSGASMIMLPKQLHDGLFRELIAFDASFESILAPFRTFDGAEKGIAMEHVKLDQWPDLLFSLKGFDDETVTLRMTPQTYWQTHAPQPNQVSFQFVYLPHWPNQSVLGLPLLNNYYTIFDRAERQTGAVMFADKRFEPHRLSDQIHRSPHELWRLFRKHRHDLS